MLKLDDLFNESNFGKYALECVSWENDADHYETNIVFLDNLNDVKILVMYLGLDREDLEEALLILEDSSDEDYEDYEQIMEAIGGYQYETDIPRVLESYTLWYLDSDGKLTKQDNLLKN